MAAGDVLSGMTRYPSAGWYSTGAYLLSGIPLLKTTAELADNASETIPFSAISREVTVLCIAGTIEVHFSDRPAENAQPSRYFTLKAGQTLTMPVRTKQVTVRSAAADSQASIAATLTGITDIAEYGKFNDDGTVGNP